MKKTKLAFWLEITSIALVSLDLGILAYYATQQPTDDEVEFYLGIAAVIINIALFIVMRKLFRLNLKSVVALRIKMLLARAAGFIMVVFEKWFHIGRHADMLGGKTSSRFDFSLLERNRPPRHKPPKWNKAQDGREKLGYLYYHLITDKMNHGMNAAASDTPTELKQREENSELENELYDVYIAARYDERLEVNESDMEELKEKMFKFQK